MATSRRSSRGRRCCVSCSSSETTIWRPVAGIPGTWLCDVCRHDADFCAQAARAFGVQLDTNVPTLGRSPGKKKKARRSKRAAVAFAATTAAPAEGGKQRPSSGRKSFSPRSRRVSPSAKRQEAAETASTASSGGRVYVPCFRRLDDAESSDEEEVPEDGGAAVPSVAVSRYSLAAMENAVAPLPGWTEPRRWIMYEKDARAAFDAAASSPRSASRGVPAVGGGYDARMRTEASDLERLNEHFAKDSTLTRLEDLREALEEHLHMPIERAIADLEVIVEERRKERDERRTSLRRRAPPAPAPAKKRSSSVGGRGSGAAAAAAKKPRKSSSSASSSSSSDSASSSSCSSDGGAAAASVSTPRGKSGRGKVRRFTPANVKPPTSESRRHGTVLSAASRSAIGAKLHAGSIVMARFKGQRYPACVLEVDRQRVDGCIVKVHYSGWNTRFDSWLSLERIDTECAHLLDADSCYI